MNKITIEEYLKLKKAYDELNIKHIDEYLILKKEYDELKIKYNELEEKHKKYTNGNSHKKYYENNSDIIKQRSKKYMEKIKETNPEKLKEWRHKAYIKQKEKKNKNK